MILQNISAFALAGILVVASGGVQTLPASPVPLVCWVSFLRPQGVAECTCLPGRPALSRARL